MTQRCGVGVGVGVSYLKESPTLGPVCLVSTYVQFCCSLFNFCAIYFTTETLFVLYTTVQLIVRRIYNFSQVILKYTVSMSHNKSWSRSQSLTKKQGLRIPE